MTSSPGRQIVIASNRGPVTFGRDQDGAIVPRRGAGGLVTALSAALQLSGGLWIASAMTPEDREVASRRRAISVGPDDRATSGNPWNVRYLAFDPSVYEGFYNEISNRVLWFLHHYLWDIPREPRFGAHTRRAWASFREVNRVFAAALDREGERTGDPPAYLVQDYHLALVPAMLRARRPQARIAHFSHVPFAGPGYLHILPGAMREELLAGYLGADVVGFHARAWADSFLLGCRTLPGAHVDLARGRVRWQGREVRVNIYPISVDVPSLEAQASAAPARRARERLDRWLGGGRLLLRVDRTELSKNILRGLLAFETLLGDHPEWLGQVRFLGLLNPSRESLPEYRSYLRACVGTGRRINAELGQGDWKPVRLSVKDDFPTALAAYGLYDVLVVNPVFDGMNLVAKEGPLVNRTDGVLILSENAGAFPELGRHALAVNPFDVGATAEAMHRALRMGRAERRTRARGLREAILANPLDRWVGAQLEDLEAVARARG